MPVAGDKVRASDLNTLDLSLPQGSMTLASSTSSVGPTSGTTEMDVITASPVTPVATGRRLRIRFHSFANSGTVALDLFTIRIKEGATELNTTRWACVTAGVGTSGTDFEAYVDSPSVTAHTYKVTIARNTGTGTATVAAAATSPMTLHVEDVGPVV